MPSRFLFFRSGAIGDIIHCLPLLKLLSERYSEARIDLVLASQQVKELLEARAPYISNIYLSSPKNISSSKELMETLVGEPVDKFIYLHSTWLKAWHWNLKYIKAPDLYLYKKDNSLNAQANFAITLFPELKKSLLEDPFEVLEYRVLDRGGTEPKAQPPYISLVPGVGSLRPHRAYPLEKWIGFISKILRDTDQNIKLLGGPDEKELSKILEDQLVNQLGEEIYRERVENLIGRTSLLKLAEILENSEHLYSCDTGILHIGAALGIPISSIYSISSEFRTGPFSPYAEVFRPSFCDCSKGNKNRANEKKHCKRPKNFKFQKLAACLDQDFF
jgi:ADP-heptose:LPS heptosyltransferase